MSRPNPKEIESPEKCIEIGRKFVSQGKVREMPKAEGYEMALLYFERALELNPQNAVAWFRKGEVLADYVFSSRWEEALHCYEQAIVHGQKKENDGFFTDVWIEKGRLLSMLDRREEGLTALDQALKYAKKVTSNVLWYSLICALVELGAPGKKVQKCANMAKDRYQRHQTSYFRDMAKVFEKAAAYRKHYLEGVAEVKRRNDEQAIKAFDRALDLFGPGYVILRGFDARLEKGRALVRLRNLDEAARVLRVLTEYFPYHSEAWSNYAMTLTIQGRIEEALHCLARAYQLNPSNSHIELVKEGVQMVLESRGLKMAEDFWDFLDKSTSPAP
jgi:tetratricopeptide (TPR) repeat protein